MISLQSALIIRRVFTVLLVSAIYEGMIYFV